MSKSTVSRVINGRPGPSMRTVRKVNSVVERIGYTPAPIDQRRGLRKSVGASMRYRQVALVMVDQGYFIYPELFVHLIAGIGTALADHGLSLIVANHPHRLPSTVRRGMIDGMLLAGSYPSQDLLDALPDVPAVWLTSYLSPHHTHVMLGNEAAGQIAAEYLHRNTHGLLAHVTFEKQYLALARRNHAFVLTLRDVGRKLVELSTGNTVHLQMADLSQVTRALVPVADRIAELGSTLAGLFCPCDRFTAALYPLLIQRGVRPMRDFPIISCGNQTCYLAGLDPQPISIDLAGEVVGRRAVEQLISNISTASHSRGESLALGAELVLPVPSMRTPAEADQPAMDVELPATLPRIT
ncbi:MAG: LacI family DNA-binding transcriptional regulator [Phycisphaeraceae bacterium]|nr:LacI family DNA-binding transcriptional regulator [Phycisphaeraceae bacterium]